MSDNEYDDIKIHIAITTNIKMNMMIMMSKMNI